ncbi:MAG: M28 family peptidase, partial [Bacteroidota bacterium]
MYKSIAFFVNSLLLFAIVNGQVNLIDTQFISKHLHALAHDSMMGRRPGTIGETRTVSYLSKAFGDVGLTPAFNNSYLQPVPLLHASSAGSVRFTNNNQQFAVDDSMMIIRTETNGQIDLKNAPLVFVGYGITAPEFDWDDYKAMNLSGKIAVVLEMEPDGMLPLVFGKQGSLSYHWTPPVKTQTAMEHGAAGVILLTAGKIISPNQKRWRQLDFTTRAGNNNAVLFIQLSLAGSEMVTQASNTSLDKLKKVAGDRHFIPQPLAAGANITVKTKTSPFMSYNLVGFIEGSDNMLKNECVVYSTHWDGYGIGPARLGDSIYNAAADNAGGIAEMLNIAKAISKMATKPKRSMVFVASTAEESGLLGANAYAMRPLFPTDKTIMAIGMDVFSPWGKAVALENSGYGYTSADTILQLIAFKYNLPYGVPSGRSVFSSSDQYAFARKGIPAIFTGIESQSFTLSASKVDSLQKITPAHSPFDEIRPEWDLRSAATEARILYEFGIAMANSARPPEWIVPV